MRAVAAAIVLASGVLAGCSLLPVPSPGAVPIDQLPVGETVVTPPEQLRVQAINQTSIPVALVVNGRARDLAPGASADLGLAELGPLPWAFTVTNATGHVLLQDTLNPGMVTRTNHGNGEGEMTGFLARADLSCGQLFIASSMASIGPAPGPGVPGDCD